MNAQKPAWPHLHKEKQRVSCAYQSAAACSSFFVIKHSRQAASKVLLLMYACVCVFKERHAPQDSLYAKTLHKHPISHASANQWLRKKTSRPFLPRAFKQNGMQPLPTFLRCQHFSVLHPLGETKCNACDVMHLKKLNNHSISFRARGDT